MQSNNFGNRPPTSGTQYGYNRPPSSGAGFGVPGTASRRQQSPWTGAQPAAGMGVSLQTAVEVAARPALKEGMKGMHMPAQQTGSRRQVMDRSYHLGQLRSKNAELAQELERLREEEQRLTKNAGQITAIGGKLKTIEGEVQKLKGELSDLNFAVEKSAGGVDVDKVNQEAVDLKEITKEEKSQIDFKFMERQKCEEKHKLVAFQVEELTAKLDAKLQDEPSRRQEYYRLREESSKLASEVYMKEKEMKYLSQRYDALAAQLNADPQKKLQFQQQERAMKLQQEVQALAAEFNGDLEAEKKTVLAQVKSDVAAIDTIQGGIKEAKSELEEARARLKSLESDLQELTGDRMDKYKQLEQRDHEMQVFIDNFEGEKKKQLTANKTTESSVVHLLEHISEQLKSGAKSKNQLDAIRDAIAGQESRVEESASTHIRLQNELELRKNELRNINNLDGKITAELETVAKRIEQHEAAMKTFEDLDGLRSSHEEKKTRLTQQNALYSQLRIQLKKLIQFLNNEYEAKRDELQGNDIHQPLQLQEQKLRQIKQNLFQLEDFIKQKTAETAYLPIKAECMRLVDDTNAFLQDPKRLEKTGSRGRAF